VLLEGVPQDYAQAIKWFQRAANQGDLVAQMGLGGCYWEGRGVPKNRVEAYRWLNLAAAQNAEGVAKRGVEAAAKARDALASEMTGDEVAEAQRLSGAFVPRKESQATARGRDNLRHRKRRP